MKTMLFAPVLGLAAAIGLTRAVVAGTPGVHDAANMFSATALNDADAKLTAVHRQHQWEIVFETVDTLGGKDPERLAKDKGISLQVRGVFFLIAKKESRIRYWINEPARAVFDKKTCDGAAEKLIAAFRKKDFDRELTDAVDYLVAAAEKHAPAASPTTTTRPVAPQPKLPAHGAPDPGGRGGFLATLLIIVAVVVGVLVLVRVLSAVASGGGASPGPGYGGGGGGFFGSLLGGLGGVFLGNWLYDTFSGRSRAFGGESTTDVGNSPNASPGFDDRGETGGGDWGDSSGDSDSGGGDGGGSDTGGSDGGDFGGDSGGGDFGGGDFGGGGGGDW